MAATKPIQTLIKHDGVDGLQENDPWSQYKPVTTNGHQNIQGLSRPDQRPVGPPRVIEGPIEQKFQSQGHQINSLQSQVDQISKQLERQNQDHQTMQQHVQDEFTKVRQETSRSLKEMQRGFDDSLQKALQNQDIHLSKNFSELKNLIMQKPNPQKKAKSGPSAGHKKDDDDDEDMEG